MSGEFVALVGFLAVAVLVAAVMLWPRFRESMALQDPVVPEVCDRLDALLAEHGSAEELREALALDPKAVRAERERWRAFLEERGAGAEVIGALEDL